MLLAEKKMEEIEGNMKGWDMLGPLQDRAMFFPEQPSTMADILKIFQGGMNGWGYDRTWPSVIHWTPLVP